MDNTFTRIANSQLQCFPTSSSTSVYVYLSKRIFLLRDYRHAPIIHICAAFLYEIVSINGISLGMLTKENKTKFARNIGLLKDGRVLLITR